jgi:hypothetical protein
MAPPRALTAQSPIHSRTMRYFKVFTLQLQRLKQCPHNMRKLSSDYQIRDFRPIHVHYGVLFNACFKYDQNAEKLEDVS